MTLRLSARLQAVADLVVPGGVLADVGCDHALLATAVVAGGLVPAAIGTDVNAGPLEAARVRLQTRATERVELRCGDGLSTLRVGEAHTIALAGMGGDLILGLLDRAPDIVAAARRIVVQPNTQWPRVRRWVAARGASIVDASLVEEAGRTFWTAAIEAGPPPTAWTEADYALGPVVRRRGGAVFERWVVARLDHLEGLHAHLSAQLGAEHPRVGEVALERDEFRGLLEPTR